MTPFQEYLASMKKKAVQAEAGKMPALLDERRATVPADRSAAVPAASRKDAGVTANISVRSRGRLPHWEAEGGVYFVTFRLADSLPQSVVESLRFEQKDISVTAKQQGRELTAVEQKRLDELSSDRIEAYLDSGVGGCTLARPEAARVVADALRFFDGERYDLIAWCVMPNHVHVVFSPRAGHFLDRILHSWKSFTSKEVNKITGATRGFWEREYYDHLVRDPEDLDRVVRYVTENPAKAGLTDWQWVWLR